MARLAVPVAVRGNLYHHTLTPCMARPCLMPQACTIYSRQALWPGAHGWLGQATHDRALFVCHDALVQRLCTIGKVPYCTWRYGWLG